MRKKVNGGWRGHFPFAFVVIYTFPEIEIVILHQQLSGLSSGLEIGGRGPRTHELRAPVSVPGQTVES